MPRRPPLSDQLREIIAARGLTNSQLSELTGVDAAVLGRFLSGEREIRTGTLDRICEALAIRVVEEIRAAPKPRSKGKP